MIGLWLSCAADPTLADTIPALDLGPLGAWTVHAVTTPAWSELTERTLLARSDSAQARIRVVDGADAAAGRDAIGREMALLAGLYDTRLPPYPEFLTREVGCPADFQPELRDLPDGRAALVWADMNLEYGACTPEAARWRALYAVLHCPASSQAIRVELLVDPADAELLEAVLSSLRCR